MNRLPARDRIERYSVWIVVALLLAFSIQAIGGMWKNSATYDEVAHLPAGYSYITRGDFRFNPEHPPLMKMIAAVPLLFLNTPSTEYNPYWNLSDEWQFGQYFLYQSGLDADRALFWGRIPTVLLGIFLGIIVFLWGRRLYGTKAALFSLFLYSFEPNIIANAQVIHTDLGASCFMLLSIFLFWRALSSPTRKKFIAAGFATGLALATKFTALILFPILLCLIFFYLLEERGEIDFGRLTFPAVERVTLKVKSYFALITFIPLLLTALFTLAASYGFLSIGKYWDGLRFLIEHNRKGNPAFLFGMYSDSGWWYYFPLAFLMKTPLPVIIIFFASLLLFAFARIRKRSIPFDELFLLVPALIIIAFSLTSSIDIGLRHILPFYPFMMIFAGGLIGRIWWRLKPYFIVLCIWFVGSAIFIFPHHISYFNELAGGPSNGYKYLVDSNYDWGQDLIRLAEFLKKEGEDSVILSYFGSADPLYYGIYYQYLPGYGLDRPQSYKTSYRYNNFLAVSATNLQSVFFNTHDTFDWLKKKEPYARAGYSIFIWRITNDEDADKNLQRLYREFGMGDPAAMYEDKERTLEEKERTILSGKRYPR